jgi:hypothetical protein
LCGLVNPARRERKKRPVSTFVLTDAILGLIIACNEPTMILAVEQNVTVRVGGFRAR